MTAEVGVCVGRGTGVAVNVGVGVLVKVGEGVGVRVGLGVGVAAGTAPAGTAPTGNHSLTALSMRSKFHVCCPYPGHVPFSQTMI